MSKIIGKIRKPCEAQFLYDCMSYMSCDKVKLFLNNFQSSLDKNQFLLLPAESFISHRWLEHCGGVLIDRDKGLLSHHRLYCEEVGIPYLGKMGLMKTFNDGDIIIWDTETQTLGLKEKNSNPKNPIASLLDIVTQDEFKNTPNIIKLSPTSHLSLKNLYEIPFEKIKGSKAKNLRIMYDNNIPVLPALVLDYRFLPSMEALKKGIISNFNDGLDKDDEVNRIIIRSNSAEEDNEYKSNSGAFESVPTLIEESDIETALQRVIDSYQSHNTNHRDYNVLIQPLYLQYFGGVTFTQHPITKKKELYTEVSRAGASAVTSGLDIGFELSQKHKEELENQCLRIKDIFKKDMDIEWGLGSKGLRIFQARPITSSHNI